jgi:hypothetical protein
MNGRRKPKPKKGTPEEFKLELRRRVRVMHALAYDMCGGLYPDAAPMRTELDESKRLLLEVLS